MQAVRSRSNNGGQKQIPLGQLATVNAASGPSMIRNENGLLTGYVYVDIAGRPGTSHLFVVDAAGTRHVDASGGDLPYGRALLSDIVNRTETAMPQAHCFLACQLVLEAQARAVRLT